MPDEFIQLGRTFHELSKFTHQSDTYDLDEATRVGKPLPWSELSKEHRVVILAEAGSGKTEEIQNIALGLRKDGKQAFFLRLEHLSDNMDNAFEVGTLDQFTSWLGGTDEGWILLDSVDEARLKSPKDFELAIKKLAKRLEGALDRTHLILTGRPNAWRFKSDLRFCTQHLPPPPPQNAEAVEIDAASEDAPADESIFADDEEEDGEADNDREDDTVEVERADVEDQPSFKVVTLDDLTPEQVGLFVSGKRVANHEEFLKAVERTDAWYSTTRPQDLQDLVEFWNDNGRIGGRLEVLRHSVDRRLRERDQERAEARPLSVPKARAGTQLLAGATTLTRNPAIRVPDGTATNQGIDTQKVLPEWPESERQTLLARPIYHAANYGTVRFHHRSAREYMAAEWFSELLKRNTSRRQIEAIFFREVYGARVISLTMRPVLAWLTILDDRIRERVRREAPELLLEGGDPSQLPLDVRRDILNQVCAQIAVGGERRSTQGRDAVQRFASADLAAEVRSLLTAHAANTEIRNFLLRMIWVGEIRELLPEAKAIALDSGAGDYSRMAAFRAVALIGSAYDLAEIRTSFAAESPPLDRDLLGALLSTAPTTSDTVQWLLAAIPRAEEGQRFSVDRLSDSITDFVERCQPEQVLELLQGMNALLETPPFVEHRHCEGSQRHQWLLASAAAAVKKLTDQRDARALEPTTLAAIRKLSTARIYDTGELREEAAALSKSIPEWPDLNRALFWHEVEIARGDLDEGQRLTDVFRVSVYGSFTRFGESDFDYLIEQIEQRAELDDRLIALSLAFDVYRTAKRPRLWRERLKKATASQPEVAEQLRLYLHPPARPEASAWKARERKWKQRQKRNEAQKAENERGWYEYLTKDTPQLVAKNKAEPGTYTNALYYLFNRAREKRDGSSRWAVYNWKTLIPIFGEAVALFYRDGAVGFWRNYKPELRSEGAPANETKSGTIFGLTGIEIESRETSQWADSLSKADVELAFRYASHELNGFPLWFPKLFKQHSETLAPLILREVTFELAHATAAGDLNYILSDLAWSGQFAWRILGQPLAEMVAAQEPANIKALEYLLTILQGGGVEPETLASLAATKCAAGLDVEHAARWFAVWTGVAPNEAISELATHVAAIQSVDEKNRFAMIYITSLIGERRGRQGSIRNASSLTADQLYSLYRLMHEHIRRVDDIHRAGTGAYSPGLRDHAQESRDAIFEALTRIQGKEGFVALQRIADENRSMPWLARYALDKAEQDGDFTSWTPEAVREFHDRLERTPSNHKELAELALFRFLDLKDELENGDTSIAGILRKVEEETDMRKYIGKDMRDKAQARYSVPQEEQLADDKMPDLRFHGVGFDAPVPIELKLADRWTGPKLFERMESQLGGDYLRDRRSARGLFVLVNCGTKASWETPSGESLSFDQLVVALQAHWQSLAPNYPGIDSITVIGIDLTVRGA